MCLFLGALAPALGAISSVAGLATSIIGIGHAQEQMAFQRQQAALQLQQQRQQAENRNQELANQYVGEAAQRDRSMKAYQDQLKYNMDAQNSAHMEQQTKLDEARTKAAFKSQEIYAKQIGAKGSVLATGRTGQSVGLLSMDADRQAGMQQAEQDAMVDSASRAASVGAQVASTQRANADADAWNQLRPAPLHPAFVASPGGGPIGQPSYNWF